MQSARASFTPFAPFGSDPTDVGERDVRVSDACAVCTCVIGDHRAAMQSARYSLPGELHSGAYEAVCACVRACLCACMEDCARVW
jgi:hypothetical protein